MRIRMEFMRGNELKFVSHLDMLKTFERAMRRADVPLAFSEGFNPHPKMSFANALAVGIISDKEYLDIETSIDVDIEKLKDSLNLMLPEGLMIITVITVDKSIPALMASVNRARYQVIIEINNSVTDDNLKAAIKRILEKEEILITKKTKKGNREKNIRPGIEELSGAITDAQVVLQMLLHTGESTVRPEEVLKALISYGSLNLDIAYTEIKKQGLYIARGENLFTPIDSAVL